MIKIYKKNEIEARDILRREPDGIDVTAKVREILEDVRLNGDEAIKKYCEMFDGGAPENIEVSREELEKAKGKVNPELLAVMQEAAENIRDFHRRQKRESFVVAEEKGKVLGQRITPLAKVGLYIPGGTACYPSSVLMNAIPAKIAEVPEICVVTPAKNGYIDPAILVCCEIAGVDRVFKVGGAQAVAALAFGTSSIPQVDKITGPGNLYVAEAKRQVYGLVDIDMIAGPSEILVISDAETKPEYVAADLLSQAEHDENAASILVTTCEKFANEVAQEIEKQIPLLSRSDIAKKSIDTYGKIILVNSIEEGIEIANEIAPEHLELCVDNPFDYLHSIMCAGSIFLGRNCPEALGDYFAGPNHTLPTGGTARFKGPLSVDDFIKKTSFVYYSKDALKTVGKKVQIFAEHEGLTAHANSVAVRMEQEI